MKSAIFGKGGSKLFGFAVLTLWLVGTEANAALPGCNVNDFTAGGTVATACSNGPEGDNKASESEIDALGWGSGWTFGGKYEDGSGLESGSLVDLLVTTSFDEWGKVIFNWSFPESQLTFGEAVFVVKQANNNSSNSGGWVAYNFDPLLSSSGNFRTAGSFQVDDFSNLSIYTRGEVTKVPEINAGGSGLTLALLLGMIAIFRERKLKS